MKTLSVPALILSATALATMHAAGCGCTEWICHDTAFGHVTLDVPSIAKTSIEVTACRNDTCWTGTVDSPAKQGGDEPIRASE